jgi:hypothetical protein
MRKVIIGLAAAIVVFGACSAEAQHRHQDGGGYNGGSRSGGWVAPLVGGMVLGGVLYGLSQPSYAAPPPVYVEQPRYRRCWAEPVFDRYTNQYLGEQRVCQGY